MQQLFFSFNFRQRDLNNIASQKCRAKKKEALLNEAKDCEYQVLIFWSYKRLELTNYVLGAKKQGTKVKRKAFERESWKTEKDPDPKWLLPPWYNYSKCKHLTLRLSSTYNMQCNDKTSSLDQQGKTQNLFGICKHL